MAKKSIGGSLELAKKIRARRTELGLTIEEAARKAGVGIKTWCRYESGESIRQDKGKGVCKALNWKLLPTNDDSENPLKAENYRGHKAWSEYLEKNFGEIAAVSFVIGSDILLDYIREDMQELSSKSKDTHIGQLGASYLAPILPPQFLMEYNYEFLYRLKASLITLRERANLGDDMSAHSVLEEILYVLIVNESEILVESDSRLEAEDGWKDWVFDLFDDEDVLTYLYSDTYLSPNDDYHFSHWMDKVFYTD